MINEILTIIIIHKTIKLMINEILTIIIIHKTIKLKINVILIISTSHKTLKLMINVILIISISHKSIKLMINVILNSSHVWLTCSTSSCSEGTLDKAAPRLNRGTLGCVSIMSLRRHFRGASPPTCVKKVLIKYIYNIDFQ